MHGFQWAKPRRARRRRSAGRGLATHPAGASSRRGPNAIVVERRLPPDAALARRAHGNDGQARCSASRRRAAARARSVRVPLPLRVPRERRARRRPCSRRLVVAALLADHTLSVAVICAVLLVVALRAPARAPVAVPRRHARQRALRLLLTPFVESIGTHAALGRADDPRARPARRHDRGAPAARSSRRCGSRRSVSRSPSTRCCVDHDRLLAAAGWARRSALAVALATRLVPTLERDARDLRRRAARPRRRRSSPVRAAVAARSPARWSAASTWPRRWRRAATAGPGGRGRRDRRGAGSTTSRSSAPWRSSSWERCGCSRRRQPALRVRRRRIAGARRRLARDRGGRARRRCSARRAPASRRSSARSPGSCRTSTAAVLRPRRRRRPRHARGAPGASSPARSPRSSRTPRTRSS